MSSYDLENDIKPKVPSKRIKLEKKDSDIVTGKLSGILHREIENEIKLRKNDLDTIEENIFLTKQCLLRLKQGVATDYYKEKSQKEYLQYPPHPAIKDTFLGKSPRDSNKIEISEATAKVRKILDCNEEAKNEPDNVCLDQGNTSEETLHPLEYVKPPCYIPPKIKVDTVKPPEPRGYVSKKHLSIVVGNVSKWLAPVEPVGATHKWTVYTKAADQGVDLSDFVSKVVFFLHPSYKPNDIVCITDPPFKLTRRGWGEFPLKARFHFKNALDVPVDVMHPLKLDHKHTGLEAFGSETTLSVWIHLPSKEDTYNKMETDAESIPVETKSLVQAINRESSPGFIKEEKSLKKNDDIYFLNEEEIKNSIAELNDSFLIKENNECFSVNENNMTDFSFTGDFFNSFSEEEFKSIHLPDFFGPVPPDNYSKDIKIEPSVFTRIDNNNESSPITLDSSDFLDECNFVESEVVIDCEEGPPEIIPNTEEIIIKPEEPSIFEESKKIIDDKIIGENNDSNNFTENNPSHFDFAQFLSENVPCENSNTFVNDHLSHGEWSDSKSVNSLSHGEDNVFKSTDQRKEITVKHCTTLLPELSSGPYSKANEVLKCNQKLLSKTDFSASPEKKQGIIRMSEPMNTERNLLKGKVISIVKLPKQVLLKKLNGGIHAVLPTKQERCNQTNASNSFTLSENSSLANVAFKSPEVKCRIITKEATALNSSQPSKITLLPKNLLCTNAVNHNRPLLVMNSLQTSATSSSQNSACHNNILNPTERLSVVHVTSGPKDVIKKKRVLKNKEIKSTIIMLQKENGQVILRKEAKIKELKDIAPGMLPKEKSQKLLRCVPAQINDTAASPEKNTMLNKKPPTSNRNTALKRDKTAFLGLQLPVINSNEITSGAEGGGLQVLSLNQKSIKIPCKSFSQKRVIPAVSLLKKLNQDSSPSVTKEKIKDDYKESVLLKRCPTQSTEVAVSWLMKRFPLIDSRAQLAGFRCKHPYCAKSRDDFLSWPFPKQRAAEWMRAKAVGKLLDKLPGISKWSTLEIWDWARIRGFTPMKINSVITDSKNQCESSDIHHFYSQPTDEIIDFIKRSKDLKEKEVVDVVSLDESLGQPASSGLSSCDPPKKMDFNFTSEPGKTKVPFEPELQGLRKFINKCQSNVGAMTSPEPIFPGILYPSAERLLISVFNSVAEDIIRRAHNASWVRHDDGPPSEINIEDVKNAICSRKEFDFLVPMKTEKKERPPVTILPNFG